MSDQTSVRSSDRASPSRPGATPARGRGSDGASPSPPGATPARGGGSDGASPSRPEATPARGGGSDGASPSRSGASPSRPRATARQSVLFYVGGHGYGHAVRSAEVIRALAGRGHVPAIHVRTTAPARFFAGIPGLALHHADVDVGAVEESALRIHPRCTMEHLAALLRDRDRLVAAEREFVRREGVGLIVSDIPFLAGEVGAAAGVPCLALGNFTWDWVYEPYAQSMPEYAACLQDVREGYAKMEAWLRLPFHHPSDVFREIVDLPLVARAATRAPEEVRAALDLPPRDGRAWVLIGMRGGVPSEILHAAAEGAGDCLFLSLDPAAADAPGNLRGVALTGGVTFTDLLAACDVVVAKPGYGIAADCASSGAALLWPPRENFREDDIFRAEAPRYLRARELPPADYHAGRWGEHLRAPLAAPQPAETLRADGAAECARMVEDRLGIGTA